MGKLLIIKGADFSTNALFREKNFNILVSANSIGYVILNANAYNPKDIPSENGGTVVTLDNTGSLVDNWFSFNASEYIQEELLYLNGAFSSWNEYTNNKIKEIQIRANTISPTDYYAFFAPIYSENILERVSLETNRCPSNLLNLNLDYLKLKITTSESIRTDFCNSSDHIEILDISGVNINAANTAYIVGHPSKVIVNECSQNSITNFINTQSQYLSETYVQSTDSEGNTVLIKQ